MTEEIVGRWFASGDGRRDRVVLATKVYGRMGDRPNEGRLSAYHIRHACEQSLRRLQTDRIDLYQMHHVDRDTPWEEIWQAHGRLILQGKVIYTGSSNFAGWHLAQAQSEAEKKGLLGLVSEQSLYNLTARTVELEVLPACRGMGLAFLPWSPLAGGILGGGNAGGSRGRRSTDLGVQRLEKYRPQIEAFEALCRDLGESPATVALAWLLAQPGVTSVIIGPRTTEQLDQALHALAVVLPDAALTRLDEIWPGPGGAAPEAYAW